MSLETNETQMELFKPGFNPVATMVSAESRDFLPQLKLPYAIETDIRIQVTSADGKPVMVDGKPMTVQAAGKLVMIKSKTVEHIKAPYVLSPLYIRDATRRSVTRPDGKVTYERTFANLDGTPNEKHDIACDAAREKNSDVKRGYNIVTLVFKGSTCGLAVMEAFSTLRDYWGEPLKMGLFNNGQGIEVTIDDHTANVKESKSNYKYYNRHAFTQWKQVTLSKDMIGLAASVCKEHEGALNSMMKNQS